MRAKVISVITIWCFVMFLIIVGVAFFPQIVSEQTRWYEFIAMILVFGGFGAAIGLLLSYLVHWVLRG